jgi:hypothetical protein
MDNDINEKPVQKYRWKESKRFNSFSDADTLRRNLIEEGYIVKVRRCGPEGSKFKVVTGELINKKNTKNKKVRKENNATK